MDEGLNVALWASTILCRNVWTDSIEFVNSFQRVNPGANRMSQGRNIIGPVYWVSAKSLND